ncbi:MAG TPA: hypothetical protein VMA97_05580 [Streptosporangiaceae bacterium]|nr:hypothetical protein [Streptosporangiaceae bacterium]
MTASPFPFDASKPHVARVYDYLLGPEPPAVRDHPVLEMACVGVARKP